MKAPYRAATPGEPTGRGPVTSPAPDEETAPLPTLLPRGTPPARLPSAGGGRPAAWSRRRSLLVVAALAGLGVVLVGALGVCAALTGPATGAAAPTASAAVTAGPVGATARGSRAGVDAPGTDVQVTVQGDTLDVVETAVLPRPPAAPTVLALTLTDLTAVPALHLPQPGVVGLAATVDGAAVTARRTASGWLLPLPTAGAATGTARVTLRYRLAQAVVHDTASATGRALLVVAPLTGTLSQQAQTPVVARVVGAEVRQVACLTAPVTDQLCGWAGTEGWVARLAPRSSLPLVVFQVDRPT